jgi:TetR/AcrR family transcriptional repressor of nem operon
VSGEELENRPPVRTGWDATTRDRIVRVAAEVVLQVGVAGVNVEQLCAAAGVSREQVHRYFPVKEALIGAVVDFQVAAVLARQRSLLANLGSLADLQRWAGDMVELNHGRKEACGCPLGSLVSQLEGQSGHLRSKVENAFLTWQAYLAAGLRRMQDRGELDAEADVGELATGVVAALQGGLLLAQVARSDKPLRAALDLAVSRVALAAGMAGSPTPGDGQGPCSA